MLATVIAANGIHEVDGFINTEKDPCASPPCKKHKKDFQCSVQEDVDCKQKNEDYCELSDVVTNRNSENLADVKPGSFHFDDQNVVNKIYGNTGKSYYTTIDDANISNKSKDCNGITNSSLPESTSTCKGGVTIHAFFKNVNLKTEEAVKPCQILASNLLSLQNDGLQLHSDQKNEIKSPSKCEKPMETLEESVSQISSSISKVTATPKAKVSEKRLKCEEEKLKKQKERELKKKERMEFKQKKEQERLKQLELKKQRQKDRQEKKIHDEIEKKLRMEKREEERRKKEEERHKKEEDRKKKEDEKNLKMLEKKRREEEEISKREKAKASFASFFIKTDVKSITKDQSDKDGKFQPFELKPFMKLADVPYRKCLSVIEKENLVRDILEQQTIKCLIDIKKEFCHLRECALEICERKRMKDMVVNDPDEVIIIEEIHVTNSNKIKVKLFQFHDNYRPAYFGSYRKKSTTIRPRRPFAKDENILNYEVDSDDEWEEEEPGESLSASEGEDEEDGCVNEDDEEHDGFFVPHGYLSDDEGDGDDDGIDNRDKFKRHLAKQKTWEAELKCQFVPKKAIAIGCIWQEGLSDILKQLEACCLTSQDCIDPMKKEYTEPVVTLSSISSPTTNCSTVMPVPQEAMPFLISILHGNEAGLKRMIQLFRKCWTMKSKTNTEVTEENWELHCTISKRQVEKNINNIARKELRLPNSKAQWFVHSNILELYNMNHLSSTSS